MTKKFVSMGDKSLATVWAWADANPGNALAEAYMEYCGAIGGVETHVHAIAAAAAEPGSRAYRTAWQAAFVARGLAFQARDTIGRLILAKIKAETVQNESPVDAGMRLSEAQNRRVVDSDK